MKTILKETQYQGSVNPVIFYNNAWHDKDGNTITLSEEEQDKIFSDIRFMEETNYRGTGLPECEPYSLQDFVDYLNIQGSDRLFLYFCGSNEGTIASKTFSDKTPVSQNSGYGTALYLFAGLNDLDETIDGYVDNSLISKLGGTQNIKFVELADLCGHLAKENINCFDIFVQWLNNREDIVGVFLSARINTSHEILLHSKRRLERYGFEDIFIEPDDGDDLVSHILIKKSWIQKHKIKYAILKEILKRI